MDHGEDVSINSLHQALRCEFLPLRFVHWRHLSFLHSLLKRRLSIVGFLEEVLEVFAEKCFIANDLVYVLVDGRELVLLDKIFVLS
jgi:hypothetical protein